MKRHTKIAVVGGGLVLFLLLALALLPALFRDRIAEQVEAGIAEAVEAQVEWEAVGLSLLRTFPNPSLRLDGLTVTGVEEFEGERLAAVDRIVAVVSLPSIWRHWRRGDPVVVRSIRVEGPGLDLVRLEDGQASWDIMREPAEPVPDERRDLAVSLRHLDVRGGRVRLDDREAGLVASLEGLEQTLEGDFSRNFFTLRTRIRADGVSVRFGGLPYLDRAELELGAEVEADMVERRFTFGENELRLNELGLAFTGTAALEEDAVDLDVAFRTPETDFRHVLSLVPWVYAADFDEVETSGFMDVSGRIQGRYGEDDLPAFSLAVRVDDGTFRYPDLPLPAREIALDLAVDNPGGGLDRTVVELSRFHALIGDEPLEGALSLRTPVSDPEVDLRVLGRLDLGELRQTVKLEGVEELAGVVTADAELHARMSWLDQGEVERVTARGGAEAHGVSVRSEDLPHAVFVDEASVRLTPTHLEVATLRGRIGESDFHLSATLENVPAHLVRGDELRGRGRLESRRFVLDEWRSEEEELEVIPLPSGVDLAVDVAVEELLYGDLVMTQGRGALRLGEERATLEDFRVRMVGGETTLTGFYETTDPSRPTFEVDLAMREVEIPAAFRELVTVRALAPVAGYARGTASTELRLGGALGADMAPLFETLSGRGTLETSRLALEGFPALDRVADALRIPQLRDPSFDPVRASFEIRDGRMHVSPFEAGVGELRLAVSGSHGVDQTLDYELRLAVPRALLGTEAERAVEGLLSRAGRLGVELEAAETIELRVALTGTVSDPEVRTDVERLLTTAREEVEDAVREEAGRRLEDLERRRDEATEEARAEAERVLQEAEARAERLREEAREAAERVRREGNAAADSVLARAANPVARAAARPVADRLRREAEERAEQVVREADERAERILQEANRRAEEILGRPPPGGR